MSIQISNQTSTQLPTQPLVDAVLATLRAEGSPNASVSVLLCDDAEIHALNHQYRGYDKPTDVLSFAQRDEFPGEPGIPDIPELTDNLGDVVVSLDTAQRQAEARGAVLDDEVRLLLVHGTLHLLGYEDDTDDGADEMRAREIELGVRVPDDLPSSAH